MRSVPPRRSSNSATPFSLSLLSHLQRQQLAKLLVQLPFRGGGHQDGVHPAADGVQLLGGHDGAAKKKKKKRG